MWVQQRVGPFPANQAVVFPGLAKKENNKVFPWKYVRIGIQAPQSPYVTETRDVVYSEKINNFPRIDSDIVPQDTPTVNRMNAFKIGIGNNIGNSFCINENEIIEFCDLGWTEYFKVTPMQYADEYTIIEIQYMDDMTS